MTTLFDASLFADLCARAAAAPRLRVHHNLHTQNEDPCHRLLVAIAPGSYVPPHRHLDEKKGELLVVLQGELGVLLFADDGSVQQALTLRAGTAACGIDITPGNWHAVVALQPQTVFLECKAGPYVPLLAEERAVWAPGEGEQGVASYLDGLVRQFA
ncbi:WbuC family cupin fold metalloprotein [Chitinilyticum piscinae]|uniref:WbuC family cupin fold metalloprotein n=1 Tax=Chitinilyticum piscinae TaxID=2866724 RepID=A0A8J7FYW3_9NEIS|nr:WbuC family cupin fold metalloprotein [Chitinilyticum piscinae]MBE9608885.1 WbuC family cupin fold metalloprotein [Chitinilyticum piscinae]